MLAAIVDCNFIYMREFGMAIKILFYFPCDNVDKFIKACLHVEIHLSKLQLLIKESNILNRYEGVNGRLI